MKTKSVCIFRSNLPPIPDESLPLHFLNFPRSFKQVRWQFSTGVRIDVTDPNNAVYLKTIRYSDPPTDENSLNAPLDVKVWNNYLNAPRFLL